ncbi:hypothetical protein J3B02_002155 [Coemansia erecta]|uniref:Uncharacterized protein n=1 Tax=Coemansia asiatica TaxID=1052880 RepID=A0A9W8CKD2_9FUNG|nr:hypothetical protein LPJ64_003047 [Coemansia asiatica]KAJ2855459.1 hypothetical protein J3B02_002155 [Coemansia erecta]KAJ2878326.1 hypothetical protein FB639_003419 [Coemansia asiatica]
MATPEAPLREILKAISFTQFPLRINRSFFTPETIDSPQLYIHRPLTQKSSASPSCDVKSMSTLALLRFVGFKADIKYSSEPEASPNNQLPYLLLPDSLALDARGIESHLREQGVLGESELADEMVYLTMVENNLIPVTEYLAWIDPEGFDSIGWQKYLGSYPMIVRYFLGWQKRLHTSRKLQTGLPEYGSALDGDVIYENAFRALDSLVVLLGERKYFSGIKPGVLDALVFACLNVIVEAPLKSPIRSAMTREGSKYKTLLDFTMRILEEYFQ